MDIHDILNKLEINRGIFPRQAIKEAIARQEQITPELLRIIEELKDNAATYLDRDDYMAHIYAMYLLAQFRQERAYQPLVDFFSLPGEIAMDLTGDVVTEDLARILASVSGGDPRLMISLIENESANEWVRSATLRGLAVLAANGLVPRSEIVTYYGSLFQGKLAREYSEVWNGLAVQAVVLYPEELLEDIRLAFEDELVDRFSMDLDYVEETLAQGMERTLAELREDRHYQLIDDTIREMEWWACFQQRPSRPIAPRKKVGRNEPCPCGSGKKYKRCCGRRRG